MTTLPMPWNSAEATRDQWAALHAQQEQRRRAGQAQQAYQRAPSRETFDNYRSELPANHPANVW